jgi:putative redox protein
MRSESTADTTGQIPPNKEVYLKMKSSVTLKDGMHFRGALQGFDIPLDAAEQFGGKNLGPQPKGLMLTSLVGCTAMDVISMLRKMKSEPDEFSVEAETEVTDEHPKVFTSIMITYRLKGENLDREKIEKAVKLSQEKYCGVSAMLQKAAPVEYQIVIE